MSRPLLVVLLFAIPSCGPGDGYEYVACATRADCIGSADCHPITWRGGSGNLCTAPCGTDRDCPHSGRCVDVDGTGTFLCYDACAPSTCATGFTCQSLTTGGSICLPTAM